MITHWHNAADGGSIRTALRMNVVIFIFNSVHFVVLGTKLRALLSLFVGSQDSNSQDIECFEELGVGDGENPVK